MRILIPRLLSELARTQGVQPRDTGDPYRILEKTIGYVDLKRLTVHCWTGERGNNYHPVVVLQSNPSPR